MRLSVTLFDLVVSFGALQGIVVAIILCFLPFKSRSKTLFSFVLLVIALLSFKILLHTLGLWDQPLLRYFPLAIDTTLQPLLYLYIGSITTRQKPFSYSWFYFLPTIFFMLYAVAIYLLVLPEANLNLKDGLANKWHFNTVKSVEDIIAVVSAMIYWIMAYRRIDNYRQWLFRTQSDNGLQEFAWLKNMLLISGGLVIGLTAIVTLDDLLFTGGHHFLHLQLFYFYLALITYYLSFKGYELYSINKSVVQPFAPTISVETNQLEDTGAGLPRSQARTQQELEAIKVQIIEALETDRLFLNPELTVKELAQHIACPSAVASLVINQYFQMNFRNLINTYRVEEVQKQLRNPPAHLSILGIALDCGFNSEASFYRIFRQQTGLSPNDYVKKHQP